MKIEKTTLILLTGVFLLGEIKFNDLIRAQDNNYLFASFVKALIFLLFIFLFSKGLNWAKWILFILLTLNGLLFLLASLDMGLAFLLIGTYNVFFALSIHWSKALKVFREKDGSTMISNSSEAEGNGNELLAEVSEYQYPRLVRRYKSLLIDGLLQLTILIIIMVLFNDSEARTRIMVSSGLLLLALYEPLLTVYSRTVGQRMMKIRIGKHESPSEKIGLLNSYVRWFIKSLLGWLSFITINFNPEHRAIHDLASGSVVIVDE